MLSDATQIVGRIHNAVGPFAESASHDLLTVARSRGSFEASRFMGLRTHPA